MCCFIVDHSAICFLFLYWIFCSTIAFVNLRIDVNIVFAVVQTPGRCTCVNCGYVFQETNGQVAGGGVSVFYSHALQLLFFSYSQGMYPVNN